MYLTKEVDLTMICDCCGGKGKVIDRLTGKWVNCPKCYSAIKEAQNSVVGVDIETEAKTSDVMDRLHIPKIYREIKYSEDIMRSHGQDYILNDVTALIDICNRIRDDLLCGELPINSYYIHCPAVLDIDLWVYTLQRIAISKNISTVPYISVNELAKYITDNGYTDKYEDYINAQLCILDLSARITQIGSITLADLITVRAKKGLPTIVTGYWSTEWIWRDTNNDVRFIISTDECRLNKLLGNTVRHKSNSRRVNGVVSTKGYTPSSEVIDSASQLLK